MTPFHFLNFDVVHGERTKCFVIMGSMRLPLASRCVSRPPVQVCCPCLATKSRFSWPSTPFLPCCCSYRHPSSRRRRLASQLPSTPSATSQFPQPPPLSSASKSKRRSLPPSVVLRSLILQAYSSSLPALSPPDLPLRPRLGRPQLPHAALTNSHDQEALLPHHLPTSPTERASEAEGNGEDCSHA